MSNRPTRKPSASARVAQARQVDARRSAAWVYGGVAVAVVLALLLAVIVASRGDDGAAATIKGGGTIVPKGEVAYGDIVVTGAALAERPDGSTSDPAVGQVVPAITGEQFDGTALSIPATGTPKVVMFLAHWCPHCQAEVPLIAAELAQHGLPSGVDLYGVTTSTTETRVNFPPADWLRKESWPVRTIADDAANRAAAAYGVTGFPTFVAVDASGKVVARTSGELTVEQFRALVDAARTGVAPTSAAAGAASPAS